MVQITWHKRMGGSRATRLAITSDTRCNKISSIHYLCTLSLSSWPLCRICEQRTWIFHCHSSSGNYLCTQAPPIWISTKYKYAYITFRKKPDAVDMQERRLHVRKVGSLKTQSSQANGIQHWSVLPPSLELSVNRITWLSGVVDYGAEDLVSKKGSAIKAPIVCTVTML